MRQTAKVVYRDGKLMAMVERPEACMSCRACEYGQRSETLVELPKGKYREGDTVEMELERGRLSKASLLAYGIPLAGLLAGLVIGNAARLTEPLQAVTAVAGALLGFGALKLLEPRFRSFRPKATPCMQNTETPKGE